MPTGWGVKPCTGAPSASHQDLDRWSSVQANFLLLWLCLLSALISNAVMKSEAIGGKGKVCFFLFFALVLLLATGRRLKGHLVSFSAAKRGLISPFFRLFCSHCAWHFAGFYWTFIQTKTALHDLFKQHHGQLDMVGKGGTLCSLYTSPYWKSTVCWLSNQWSPIWARRAEQSPKTSSLSVFYRRIYSRSFPPIEWSQNTRSPL